MKRAFLVSALLAAAAQAQTVTWDKWDPMAVRTNRTVDVMLTLQTAGTVNGVRLDYANGGSIALTQSTPGVWTAFVNGFSVNGRSDQWQLGVTADGLTLPSR